MVSIPDLLPANLAAMVQIYSFAGENVMPMRFRMALAAVSPRSSPNPSLVPMQSVNVRQWDKDGLHASC